MWDFETTEEYDRRHKHYEKKHPRELKAVLANLDVLQQALRAGANPRKLPFGFLHIERQGVLAVDQKGGGKDLAQTRLYFYLDGDDRTIHLITLGDKANRRSQGEDIKAASDYVEGLLSQKGRDEHGEEDLQEHPGTDPESGRG